MSVHYFFREDCENLNWGAAAEVFVKISKLLEIPCYQYAVLSGIILSAGGLSESLVRTRTQILIPTRSAVLFQYREM